VRYFRSFVFHPDGVLRSPIHRGSPNEHATTDRFPYRDMRATCNLGHQPPEPACTCGLYVWKSWWHPRICQHARGPRVFAEVEVPGAAEQVSGVCPIFPLRHSARVAALRLVELWLPGPAHCLICAADPGTVAYGEQTAARLAARYGVPVARLPDNPNVARFQARCAEPVRRLP
jgi:hypothetical protein